MARVAILLFALLFSVSCGTSRRPDLYVDSSLETELAHIQAIDNHAHPQSVVIYGDDDHDYDALPTEIIEDLALPSPFRAGSPLFAKAWGALFGYSLTDSTPEHLNRIEELKHQEQKQRADSYPTWVLNKTNTEIMLANRVAMGRGLTSDRFKWVPFADMFLFPLNNALAKARDPEHRAFITAEETLLGKYRAAAQMKRLPASLDEYLTFISHTLESWRASGAVAVKFELAYLRDLDISDPHRENAERVYSIYAQSSEPTPEEYKILQDYVFRHIAHEAGRLEMPVHIHCSIGAGSYFRDANANPFALEGVFNDPTLRKTKFVMLHGSWPYAREAAALILKPNVYVDFSAFMYMMYPVEAARAIRLYLEAAPRKVLYGSDASPFSNQVGWEETAWIGSTNGRLSLGIALTGMVEDNEITAERARQIAHLVMRENARQLYHF